MNRVIFLSQSKLLGKLFQFFLAETPFQCLCFTNPKEVNTLFSQDKTLFLIIDDSLAHNALLKNELDSLSTNIPQEQILYLNAASQTQDTHHSRVLTKPFSGNELWRILHHHFEGNL